MLKPSLPLHLIVIVTGGLSACSLFSGPNLPKAVQTVLADAKIACILEKALLDQAALNLACDLVGAEEQALGRGIAGAHKASLARRAAMNASSCDAGVSDAAASDAGVSDAAASDGAPR